MSAPSSTTYVCPFCEIIGVAEKRGFLVHRDDNTVVIPSTRQRPQNPGHLLVGTTAHLRDLYTLPDDLLAPVLGTVRLFAQAVRQAFSAGGVTVLQHNDIPGGQHVFHIHFHVVARHSRDGFYGGSRPFPGHMLETSEDDRIEQAARV